MGLSPLPLGRHCQNRIKCQQQSSTFLAPGTHFVEDNFPMDQVWGDGFGMIQVCYIDCALYLYYYISSTSDYQVLDVRGWEPLNYGTPSWC